MGHSRDTLTLDGDDRTRLERIAGSGQSTQTQALRARILLTRAETATDQEAACRTGVSANTVRRWRLRYSEEAQLLLDDRPRRGRPASATEAAESSRLLRLLLEPPASERSSWSTRTLAEATGMSQSSVSRLMSRLRPIRAVERHSGDAQWVIAGVMLTSGVQALACTPGRPAAPARSPVTDVLPTLGAVARLRNLPLEPPDLTEHDATTLLGFLSHLVRTLPAGSPISVTICGSAQLRSDTDVRHWVRRNAKTQLEFVDDWLMFSARIATRIGNSPLPPEVRAEFRQWADGSQDQTTWTRWGRGSNAVISDSHPRNTRSPSELPLPFGHAAQGVSPVITTLQEQLASGELDPGSAISQAGLARLSGLSGSRVREALRLLSADGTVEEVTANRFAVPAVTAKTVMDAYAVRVTLGSLLLRSIIADRHADLTDIRNALDKVEAAVRDPTATEIGDADLNFQDSLARVSTMTHAATAFLRTTVCLRLVISSVRIDYSIIPERIVRGDRTIYHGLRGRDAQTAVGAWWSKANIAVRYMVAQLPTERFDAHYWSFSTGLPQP